MPRDLGRIVRWASRNARKVVVGVVGTTLVMLGAAMLLLPGPGLLTIFVGLTVLAAEFAWARRWLRRAREIGANATRRGSGAERGTDAPP